VMMSHAQRLDVWMEERPCELECSEYELAFGACHLSQNDCGFTDFCMPNELHIAAPNGVSSHLTTLREDEWIVSVGTERSLWDLLLAPKCAGLIVQDINWQIKAYIDCVAMMLRLSNSFEEFQGFVSWDKSQSLGEKKALFLEKLASIPSPMREYYREQMDVLLSSYFQVDVKMGPADTVWNHMQSYEGWRVKNFELIDYHKDENLYKKLKGYADNGRIIARVGSINDLEEVAKVVPIGIVDTSNVHEYEILHLQLNNQTPVVIFTKAQFGCLNEYESYKERVVSKEEGEEIYELLDRMTYTESIDRRCSFLAIMQTVIRYDIKPKMLMCASLAVSGVRECLQWYEAGCVEFYDFRYRLPEEAKFFSKKVNEMCGGRHRNEKAELEKQGAISKIVSYICKDNSDKEKLWETLNSLRDWQDSFDQIITKERLEQFISVLGKEQFINAYGAERFDKLCRKF